MAFSMGTRNAILIALTMFSCLTMVMGQSGVPAFSIFNSGAASIGARCIALANQGDAIDLGQTILTPSATWGKEVPQGATSVQCNFSLVGMMDEDVVVWETPSFLYDLPVACTNCQWQVNQVGFYLTNPQNMHLIEVAAWIPISSQ